MAEERSTSDHASEQQTPGHSPVEEEFADNRADTPAPRDGITILGYSLGVILVAVFVLFLIAVAIAILVS
ncbi:hypothetical protein BH23CHL2_BH23CHL2_25760 [soil metagenome]